MAFLPFLFLESVILLVFVFSFFIRRLNLTKKSLYYLIPIFVLMPLIGLLTGGVDFTKLTAKVGDATVNYGTFIQNIVDFLIIAFCIFLMIKGMNKLMPKKEEEPAAPAGPTQEELLTEIRDLLKKK